MGSYPDGPTFWPAKMLLSPVLDIQEQDVHISDKHTPDPLHPSPSEGSGDSW